MAEIAGDMQEGLLALAVGTGLQVMAALMDGRRDGAGRAEGPRTTRTGPRCATAARPGR